MMTRDLQDLRFHVRQIHVDQMSLGTDLSFLATQSCEAYCCSADHRSTGPQDRPILRRRCCFRARIPDASLHRATSLLVLLDLPEACCCVFCCRPMQRLPDPVLALSIRQQHVRLGRFLTPKRPRSPSSPSRPGFAKGDWACGVGSGVGTERAGVVGTSLGHGQHYVCHHSKADIPLGVASRPLNEVVFPRARVPGATSKHWEQVVMEIAYHCASQPSGREGGASLGPS